MDLAPFGNKLFIYRNLPYPQNCRPCPNTDKQNMVYSVYFRSSQIQIITSAEYLPIEGQLPAELKEEPIALLLGLHLVRQLVPVPQDAGLHRHGGPRPPLGPAPSTPALEHAGGQDLHQVVIPGEGRFHCQVVKNRKTAKSGEQC